MSPYYWFHAWLVGTKSPGTENWAQNGQAFQKVCKKFKIKKATKYLKLQNILKKPVS